MHELLGRAALAAQQQAVFDLLQDIRSPGQQASRQTVGDNERAVGMDRLALPRLADGVINEMRFERTPIAREAFGWLRVSTPRGTTRAPNATVRIVKARADGC